MAFLAYQFTLTRWLGDAGLRLHVQMRGNGIFQMQGNAEDVVIEMPTYLDDFAIQYDTKQ